MSPIEEEFLEAIKQHPNDPTYRLVYADWLEEHGKLYAANYQRELLKDQGEDQFHKREELKGTKHNKIFQRHRGRGKDWL